MTKAQWIEEATSLKTEIWNMESDLRAARETLEETIDDLSDATSHVRGAQESLRDCGDLFDVSASLKSCEERWRKLS